MAAPVMRILETARKGDAAMQRRWLKPLHYGAILGVILCSGVMLSGCDVLDFLGDIFRTNGNEAQAQQDGLVETFLIRPGSFAITSNNAAIELGTNVEIKDQVTIYTQIDGSISFILGTGTGREFREVVVNDIVFERPALNQVTLIRRQ